MTADRISLLIDLGDFIACVMPKVGAVLGCECRMPSEAEPSGYACAVCRWGRDTAAMLLLVERAAIESPVASEMPPEVRRLLEEGEAKLLAHERECAERERRAAEARLAKYRADWTALYNCAKERLPWQVHQFIEEDERAYKNPVSTATEMVVVRVPRLAPVAVFVDAPKIEGSMRMFRCRKEFHVAGYEVSCGKVVENWTEHDLVATTEDFTVALAFAERAAGERQRLERAEAELPY